MTLIEKFLAVVAVYQAEKKLSTSRLSFLVFGDGKVLGGLINGSRDITTRRLEAALSWFSKNWPKSAVWPDCVARPECLGIGEPPEAQRATVAPAYARAAAEETSHAGSCEALSDTSHWIKL